MSDVPHISAGCKQKSTSSEISFRVFIHHLTRYSLFSNRLNISNLSVRLQSCFREILPCPVYNLAILGCIKNSIVYSPQHTISKDSRSTRLWSRSLQRIHH